MSAGRSCCEIEVTAEQATTPPLVAEVAELGEFLSAFARMLEARGVAERLRLAPLSRDWRAPAVLNVLQHVYGEGGAYDIGTHEPDAAREVLVASAQELRRLGRVLLDAAVLVAAEAGLGFRRPAGACSAAEVGEADGGAAPSGPRRNP